MVRDKKLITAQALAEVLDLSVETIWRYTRELKIPAINLGAKQYRYNLTDVINALTGQAIKEDTANYNVDTATKKFTYQDYLKLPEEPGYHFEVLDGVLCKEPSPNVPHQRISRRLQRILEDYFWVVDPDGEVFNAPLDVTLYDINVVQPDLFYVSGGQKEFVKNTRVDGPPFLLVEILSPSSRRRDRLQKMEIYRKTQVQHYWIVSPEDQTIECYCLQDGAYAQVAAGMDDDVLEHPSFEGLSIALGDLW